MRKFPGVIVVSTFCLLAVARAGIDPGDLDPSVQPRDDFFLFANGTWLKKAVIPPDQAAWGSFVQLHEINQQRLHEICERAAAKGTQATGAERLVGDFYASGMDEAAVNAAGIRPLRPYLDRIAAIRTPDDVWTEIARMRALGLGVGFGFGGDPDAKDSNRTIAQLGQGGICLPGVRGADRDYYLNPEPKYVTIRDHYAGHVARMLELAGDSHADALAGAKAVLEIETALAKGSLSRLQLRDPRESYHKTTVAELAQTTGDLEWQAYLHAVGTPAFTEINLAHPEFFKAFAAEMKAAPVAAWKAYLRWHLIHATAPWLGNDIEGENFRFFATTLSGVKQQKPRWQRVIRAIDGSIGDALGELYVTRYFPPPAKARALQLVGDLRDALRGRIGAIAWMDEPTRGKALEKLESFRVKIGYPDTWKDYSAAKIDRGSYVLNILRANEAESRRQLARIGQPVDLAEWHISAPTINATYSPEANCITFPAGILQPPFFDPQADDAVNYGGIGAVIGHEMTHGFDDSGRQFDAKGNLNDWWTPASAARFKDRSRAIVKQFSGYVVQDGLHVKGELTQGENIADLGGLKIAYAALQKTLAGKPHGKIDGFTPEQRFFLSYAKIWQGVVRPEEQANRLNVDPHSPPAWRVRGPLSNLDEFAQAFGVPEGAPMRRPAAERVEIW